MSFVEYVLEDRIAIIRMNRPERLNAVGPEMGADLRAALKHFKEDDGAWVGVLKDKHGKPLVIDGLWTITLGGGKGSSSDTLFFTAGPNGESDGLFGTIAPVADAD